MKKLDDQMRYWSSRLVKELGIDESESKKLATTIAAQIRWLPPDAKAEIQSSSPVEIKKRYDELIAFQSWMDIVNSSPKHPGVIRAQVIVQNYICFVYLSDTCFKVMRKYLPNNCAAKKCCNYLINNPVRAFRNAIAHSNWCYKDDFSGIKFWAKKGAEQEEPLVEWEVNQEELSFWQALARCVAYAAYENLQ